LSMLQPPEVHTCPPDRAVYLPGSKRGYEPVARQSVMRIE
jgi:hypothetical protein